jgi:hypothetical protein
LGAEDAQGRGQLEEDVDRAAEVARRHLREVERDDRVAKADADAQQHPPDYHHGDVDRAGGERGAGEEGERGGGDERAAAVRAREAGGRQRRRHARDVEGGRE